MYVLKNKILKATLKVICFAVLFAPIIFTNKVFAIDWDTIRAKAVFNGVYTCASLNSYLTSWEVKENGSNGRDGFIDSSASSHMVVAFPYNTSVAENRNYLVNCKEIMTGWGWSQSGLSFGLVPNYLDDETDTGTIMKFYAGEAKDGNGGIGYKAAAETESEEIYRKTMYVSKADNSCSDANVYWRRSSQKEYNPLPIPENTLIFPAVGSDGFFIENDEASNLRDGDVLRFCGKESKVKFQGGTHITFSSGTNGVDFNVLQCQVVVNGYQYGDDTCSVTKGPFADGVSSAQMGQVTGQVIVSENTVLEKVRSDFALKMAAGLMEKNMWGYKIGRLNNYYDLALTSQEVYDLYAYYLKNVFKIPVSCEGDSGYSTSFGNSAINWIKGKKCRANTAAGSVENPENVFGVYTDPDDEAYFHFGAGEVVNADKVVETLNRLNIETLDTETTTYFVPEEGPPEEEETTKEVEPTCMSAGSEVAWMLCPILNLATNASETVYGWVEPLLNTPPQIFSSDANGGTRKAWEIFQQIANVFFIALFLVVIFSQLTGVGIDNYGIKKILPKLIIAAVLINLSFVICQIMVDLSNIAGNGLKNLFEGIELNISEEGIKSIDGVTAGAFSSVWGTVKGGLLGLALLALLSRGIWSIGSNLIGILIGLVMTAISLLFAILFLYVLLAARQTLIVLMTVISPLAFACYILPNTKKLFDKWTNVFKGMLLVYPICGLLIGVGDFTTRLMFATGIAASSLGATLLAMAMSVIPVFFFPTVLKNSFSVLGKFGSTFAGFGGKARRGISAGIKKTEPYRNYQQRHLDRKKLMELRRRAGGRVDANGQFVENGARSRIARTNVGRALGMDRAMGKARTQYVQEESSRLDDALGLNADVQNTALQKAANARVKREEEGVVGVEAVNRANVRRDFENEQLKVRVENQLGPKPILNIRNLQIRRQNELNEARADNAVPPLAISGNVALQRRQSARDAQEYKAFQEQFAGTSKNGLAQRANNASAWFSPGNASSVQEMRALIGALNNNGMESSVFNMLRGTAGVENCSAVMTELANASNKVMRAFGKMGTGMSYENFMSGRMYQDANGNLTNDAVNRTTGAQNTAVSVYRDSTGNLTTTAAGNKAVSINQYIAEKGSSFASGIDDKAMSEVVTYTRNTGNQIMSGQVLLDVLANATSQDVANVADRLITERNATTGNYIYSSNDIGPSGDDLVRMKTSSVTAFVNRANNPGETVLQNKIIASSNDIRNDPKALNSLKGPSRDEINRLIPNNPI